MCAFKYSCVLADFLSVFLLEVTEIKRGDTSELDDVLPNSHSISSDGTVVPQFF
jgi:hypothetical protein